MGARCKHLILLLVWIGTIAISSKLAHGSPHRSLKHRGSHGHRGWRRRLKQVSLLKVLAPMQRKTMMRQLDEMEIANNSTCGPECTKNGVCNEELARCDCPRHYSGLDCSVLTTNLTGVCKKFGFKMTGIGNCMEEKQSNCLNACNYRGVCRGGFCHCNPGFWGTDCALSMDENKKPVLLAGLGYEVRKRPPTIYVYELPPEYNNVWYNAGRLDRPLFLLFWQRLLSAGVRTLDGDNADYYYMPIKHRMGGMDSENALAAIKYIRETWPWWNKTGGNRHLIIQTGDMGRREATEPVRALADNCSWISHWGLYKDKSGPKWPSSHRPGKDIVVPIFLQSSLVVSYGMHTTPVHPNAEPVNRSQTFFFAGRICGDRKEPIAGEWPNCDTEVAGENGYSAGTRQKVHYHFSNRTGYKVVVSTKTYARDMARSKFCLAPTGGGHGKRQVLVAMLGCIPVTMTDYVYQPFEPEIDWSEFSVPIQEKEIPQMADKLESLSDAEVASLQSRLKCGAQHIFWSSIYGSVLGDDGRYDAFETTMEILRMQLKYPGLAPEKYAETDEDFNKFMHCETLPLQETPDLCSYADIKSSHFPCKECAKAHHSHLLRPGGAICCSERNLAKCPRLWE